MRTFIAIELPGDVRRALREAVGRLRSLGGGVRWQSPQTMHLTLKFIGDVNEKDLPDLIAVLDEIAGATAPFDITLDGLSGFPPRGTPRVVHVPVREPSGLLEQLQKNIERELSREIGIDRDGREYIPHITLGRVKDRRKAPTLEQMRQALPEGPVGRIQARSFILFKSDLTPDGAVHTPVHEFSFHNE